MGIKKIFGFILLLIILALVIYGLVIKGVSGGFESLFGIFKVWIGKLFSPS